MTIIDQDSLNAVFASVEGDGGFDGPSLSTARRLGARRNLVLLSFPPKAAGTFFRSMVIDAIDGQLVRVTHAQGGRDATPYLPTFINYFSGGITPHTLVSHVHMLALPANLNFLEAFGIQPVVMMRSIPDMLASYWDMLESDDNALSDGVNCHIPPGFRELPQSQKAEFLINILAPWYVNFYAGWLDYAGRHPERVCLLDYRDFVRDTPGTLGRALEAIGLSRSREVCEAAGRRMWELRREYRFNVGRSGRGARYFSCRQLEQLRLQLGFYPVLAEHADELIGAADDAGWQAAG